MSNTKERCPKCGALKQEGTGFYDCGTAQSGNSIPCEQSKLCYTRQQARQELLAEVIGEFDAAILAEIPDMSEVPYTLVRQYASKRMTALHERLKTLQGDSETK